MTAALFEQDVEEELRMPWALICKAAVKARCLGISLNDLTEMAMAAYLEQHHDLPAGGHQAPEK